VRRDVGVHDTQLERVEEFVGHRIEERVGHGEAVAAGTDRARRGARLLDRADATRYVSTQWSEAKVRERYHWLFSYDAVGCPLDA